MFTCDNEKNMMIRWQSQAFSTSKARRFSDRSINGGSWLVDARCLPEKSGGNRRTTKGVIARAVGQDGMGMYYKYEDLTGGCGLGVWYLGKMH